MSGWVRWENNTPETVERKALERGLAPLSDRAFRLYFNASCFASRAQSNGVVPASKLKSLTDSATKRTVDELVAMGLLDVTDGGDFLVHDYLEYNPSRERIKEMREQSKATSARHRGRSEPPSDTPRDSTGDTAGDASPSSDVTSHDADHPHVRDRSGPKPTGRPQTEDNDEGEEKNNHKPKEPELQRASDDVLLIVNTLTQQIVQRDPKAKVAPESDTWLREARLLLERDGRSIDQVMAVLQWLPTSFWAKVVLSVPKFRERFTQLVADMNAAPAAGAQRNGAQRLQHGTTHAAADRLTTWCAEKFPDLAQPNGSAHPGVLGAVIRLGGVDRIDWPADEDRIRRFVAQWDERNNDSSQEAA